MKLSLEVKAIIIGSIAGLTAVGIPFAAGGILQQKTGHVSGATQGILVPAPGTQTHEGYALFLMNCAHCHGSDARGDEGPDLHGITRSEASISALIRNGRKGEMPKFGAKLSDSQIRALVAFINSMRD